MNARSSFHKVLIFKLLQFYSDSRRELVSHCKPAAFTILPPKACALSGGVFCALLLTGLLGLQQARNHNQRPETRRSCRPESVRQLHYQHHLVAGYGYSLYSFGAMSRVTGIIRCLLRSCRTRRLNESAMAIADRYEIRKEYLVARKFGYSPLETLEDWGMVGDEERKLFRK